MQKLWKGAHCKVRVLCITAHTADVSTLTGEGMGGARTPSLPLPFGGAPTFQLWL